MGQTSSMIRQASRPPVKNYVNFSYFSRALQNWLFWSHIEVSNDLNGLIMWKTLVWIDLTLVTLNSISNSLRKPEKPNPSILVLHPVHISPHKNLRSNLKIQNTYNFFPSPYESFFNYKMTSTVNVRRLHVRNVIMAKLLMIERNFRQIEKKWS